MPDAEQNPHDVELLAMALDHAWRWWEFRINNGLQVLNFFLLASSIMVAAYVSALSSHLYIVAGAIALLGAGVSAASYVTGKRQSDVAGLAVAPLRDVQDKLADALDIDSLRMVDRYRDDHRWLLGGRVAAHFMFPVAAIAAIVAAAYAWLGH